MTHPAGGTTPTILMALDSHTLNVFGSADICQSGYMAQVSSVAETFNSNGEASGWRSRSSTRATLLLRLRALEAVAVVGADQAGHDRAEAFNRLGTRVAVGVGDQAFLAVGQQTFQIAAFVGQF